MVVGVCRLTLLLPSSHSLKERRMVLRRIKDKVRHKFNAAIADVGTGEYRDSWQSAQLGFSVVSNDLVFTQEMVRTILEYVEDLAAAKVMHDEQEYLQYGDEIGGGPTAHEAEFTEADFLRGALDLETEAPMSEAAEDDGGPGGPRGDEEVGAPRAPPEDVGEALDAIDGDAELDDEPDEPDEEPDDDEAAASARTARHRALRGEPKSTSEDT